MAAINTLKQIFAARGTLGRSFKPSEKHSKPLKGNGSAFTSKARFERARSDKSLRDVARCL